MRERHVCHCRGAGQWTFAAGVEAHRRANSGRSVSFAGALALFLGALVLYAAAKIIVEVLIARGAGPRDADVEPVGCGLRRPSALP